MREANFAPVYCSLYPEFAEIARKHGYALAIHGSLARDMDLVAIPWTDSAGEPQAVVDAIVSEFSITQANGWTTREHGRLVTTLVIAFGDCFVDLSFMPVAVPAQSAEPVCWIERSQLDQLEDLTSDAWVYWRETGHVAEADELALYAAPPPPAPESAPVGLTSEQIDKAMELAHTWATATYYKGLGKPHIDFDEVRRELRALLEGVKK